MKIKDEQPFQVLSGSIIAGPSSTGYTFAYSADGTNYTNYTESTPANETLIVNGLPKGTYCKFVGNEGNMIVQI